MIEQAQVLGRVAYGVLKSLHMVTLWVFVYLPILIGSLTLVALTLPVWANWWVERTTPGQRVAHMKHRGGTMRTSVDVFRLWATRTDPVEYYERQGWVGDDE